MRRAAFVIGFVLAAGAVTRLAGAVLPAQAAMVIAGFTALGIPGWALLHATGMRQRLDTVACMGVAIIAGLAMWAVALAIGVIIGLPFWVLLAGVAIASVACLIRDREVMPSPRLDIGIGVGGTLLVMLLATRWQWSLYGDEVFHTGRIRKLLDLDRLSLDGVSAYYHGPLHAGYAFPLLHAGQAAMTSLSGLDAGVAYVNMAPFFAGVFVLTSYAAGRALGGTWVGLAAAMFAFSNAIPVHDPFLGMLQWPGPFAFYVLSTAVIIVLVGVVRTPDRRLEIALAVAVAEVAIIHPTYAIGPLTIVIGVCILCRTAWRAAAYSLIGCGAVLAWIWWVALRGVHRAPPATGQWRVPRHSDYVFFGHQAISLTTVNVVHGRVLAELALAAMLALLVAWRRRYGFAAAIMAGPLVLVAFPGIMAVLNAAAGANQMHRMWAIVPWPFTIAFAIAVVVASRRRWPIIGGTAVILALAALERKHIVKLEHKQSWFPVAVIAVAVVGIAVWYWVRGLRAESENAPIQARWWTAVVAAILVAGALGGSAGTYAHVLRHRYKAPKPRPIPAAVVDAVRPIPGLGHFPVVLGTPDLSYRLVGAAPVYIAAVPEVRSRAEPRAHPAQRRALVREFLDPTTSAARRLAIAHHFDTNYVVLNSRTGETPLMRMLARDPDYTLIKQYESDGVTYAVYKLA